MGYLAIRHYNCTDQWIIGLDDITIVEGTVDDGSASGTYNHGASCTVTATPNEGYSFVNWTEDGTAVSSSANYTFTVTGARSLVANFSQEEPTPQYALGDVNLNGTVNIQDVIVLLRSVMGGTTLSDEAQAVADVNGDGSVNINDVITLLRQTMQ